MNKGGSNPTLKKSRSMCSLEGDKCYDVTVHRNYYREYKRSQSRTISDSSAEVSAVVDSEYDDPGVRSQLADSGIAEKTTFDGEMQVLEQKIDRLSDMFLEQCRLLTTLKDDIRGWKAAMEKVELSQSEVLTDIVKKTVLQSGLMKLCSEPEASSRGRHLLDAIEGHHAVSIDQEVRDALLGFLQSDELKDHMVAATAASVRDVVGECLSQELAALYLPVLEHSHRRLVRQVTRAIENAFVELEENSANMSKSVYRVTKSLQRSIERHQTLLEAAADPHKNFFNTLKCTMEELLHKELKQWRQKVLSVFSSQREPRCAPPPEPAPPPGPAAPGASPLTDAGPSVVDQLMTSVLISKHIAEGDVNAAFSVALSAGDLAQVRAACRAVSGAAARLPQSLLLALLQQLSTDLRGDTHLKCTYIEDSIIHLDPSNPLTRAHLPLVVGEVHKHLTRFLNSHPEHDAGRRVTLIIMAADNLLK